MAYSRKISSLEESASAQVALNLSQDIGFKEVALQLETPTYGTFFYDHFSSAHFITDQGMLSNLAKSKRSEPSFEIFCHLYDLIHKQEIECWHAAVDKHCQRLTEGLPRCMKQRVQAWMHRIALEYLSYSRRQELLFGISRYFLMNVLPLTSWTQAGRLDEKKLAERLLKEEELTVLQRYRIACVYCLHVHVHELWNVLSQEEKVSIFSYDNPNFSSETYPFVLLWSRQMDEPQGEKSPLRRSYQWCKAAELAVRYGNRAALMSCWKQLKIHWEVLEKHTRQKIIIKMALKCLKGRQRINLESQGYMDWRGSLILKQYPRSFFVESFAGYNLPSYYNELMCFFLSQIDEEQQLTFFKKAFLIRRSDFVLECYLEWPHQDYFIPTINRLWGILPKERFRKCLLNLARKYAGSYKREDFAYRDREIRYYDYRSLLQTLWKETPEEYKRYVFVGENLNSLFYPIRHSGKGLLSLLLKKSPFEGEDEVLFKQMFRYLPQDDRRTMMRSSTGKDICANLTREGNWCFMNWLLDECILKEEVRRFKKKFMESDCGRSLCLNQLKDNCENWVTNLMDWSFNSDAEKTKYKYELITTGHKLLQVSYFVLQNGDVATVERMINFCILPKERKEPILAHCIKYACKFLLNACEWEKMDVILAQSFDAEEMRNFKKELLTEHGFHAHYEILFVREQYEEVDRFYKWFNLSHQEIKILKKDTLFSKRVFADIYDVLRGHTDKYLKLFRWCLTDEKMVIDLKKSIEERFNIFYILDEERKIIKESFDGLVRDFLPFFRKEEVENKTNEKDVLKESKGEKRSSITIEDGSSSHKKRSRIN